MNINLTILGQSLSFAFFVWFCWKFIWPPVVQAMRDRQKAIADGLAAGERAEKDLQLAQERATEQLRGAKDEAAAIIEAARKRGTQMVEEAKAEAAAEAGRIKDQAQAEIEQEVNRVKEGLRKQVAELAVTGAERILQAEVDRNRHAAVLDQLATEL